MQTLQTKINKIDKLLGDQNSNAQNPTKEDLEIVRKHYFIMGGRSTDLLREEVSEKRLLEIWLSVSKNENNNYRKTKERFLQMKPIKMVVVGEEVNSN